MPSSHRPALRAAARNSTLLETVFIVGLVIVIGTVIFTYQLVSSVSLEDNTQGGPTSSLPRQLQSVHQPQLSSPAIALRHAADNVHAQNNINQQQQSNQQRGGFQHFHTIAQDLASLPPAQTLEQLEKNDPFGTRTFDSKLIQQETTLGRVLTMTEVRELFPCPSVDERITLPDVRVAQKAKDFREGKKGSFLFFQHLRKAGVRVISIFNCCTTKETLFVLFAISLTNNNQL